MDFTRANSLFQRAVRIRHGDADACILSYCPAILRGTLAEYADWTVRDVAEALEKYRIQNLLDALEL